MELELGAEPGQPDADVKPESTGDRLSAHGKSWTALQDQDPPGSHQHWAM